MTKATPEETKSRLEMERADRHRAQDKMDEKAARISEAAIQSGQVAIRTAALVNGGAAAAVLAFTGGLVGQGKVPLGEVAVVAGSLMWFVYGIAAAVCSLGSAYLVNYCRRWEVETLKRVDTAPFFVATKASTRWKRAALLLQVVALLVGVSSLVLFIIGMWDLRQAIGTLAP